MAKTYSAQQFINPPQWVAEATEGTTPTASPNFTALGAVKSMSLKINGNFVDVSQIGSEDLVTIIQGMQDYESQFTLSVVNITSILDRLVDAANYASPAGTVSETISILVSFPLNAVTSYILMKGSRIKDGSIKMAVGKETEVTVSFVHTSITTPGAHGLTTPVLVTAISGTVFGWTDGGATPVTWNAAGIDAKEVTININRNSKSDHTLGNLDPHSSQPHGRRISGDFSVLHTATTLETDFKAGTARTLAIVLKTGVGTVTLTSSKLVDMTNDVGSDDDEATLERYTFRALSSGVAV